MADHHPQSEKTLSSDLVALPFKSSNRSAKHLPHYLVNQQQFNTNSNQETSGTDFQIYLDKLISEYTPNPLLQQQLEQSKRNAEKEIETKFQNSLINATYVFPRTSRGRILCCDKRQKQSQISPIHLKENLTALGDTSTQARAQNELVTTTSSRSINSEGSSHSSSSSSSSNMSTSRRVCDLNSQNLLPKPHGVQSTQLKHVPVQHQHNTQHKNQFLKPEVPPDNTRDASLSPNQSCQIKCNIKQIDSDNILDKHNLNESNAASLKPSHKSIHSVASVRLNKRTFSNKQSNSGIVKNSTQLRSFSPYQRLPNQEHFDHPKSNQLLSHFTINAKKELKRLSNAVPQSPYGTIKFSTIDSTMSPCSSLLLNESCKEKEILILNTKKQQQQDSQCITSQQRGQNVIFAAAESTKNMRNNRKKLIELASIKTEGSEHYYDGSCFSEDDFSVKSLQFPSSTTIKSRKTIHLHQLSFDREDKGTLSPPQKFKNLQKYYYNIPNSTSNKCSSTSSSSKRRSILHNTIQIGNSASKDRSTLSQVNTIDARLYNSNNNNNHHHPYVASQFENTSNNHQFEGIQKSALGLDSLNISKNDQKRKEQSQIEFEQVIYQNESSSTKAAAVPTTNINGNLQKERTTNFNKILSAISQNSQCKNKLCNSSPDHQHSVKAAASFMRIQTDPYSDEIPSKPNLSQPVGTHKLSQNKGTRIGETKKLISNISRRIGTENEDQRQNVLQATRKAVDFSTSNQIQGGVGKTKYRLKISNMVKQPEKISLIFKKSTTEEESNLKKQQKYEEIPSQPTKKISNGIGSLIPYQLQEDNIQERQEDVLHVHEFRKGYNNFSMNRHSIEESSAQQSEEITTFRSLSSQQAKEIGTSSSKVTIDTIAITSGSQNHSKRSIRNRFDSFHNTNSIKINSQRGYDKTIFVGKPLINFEESNNSNSLQISSSSKEKNFRLANNSSSLLNQLLEQHKDTSTRIKINSYEV